MNIRNDFINSGKKIIHKKENYRKLNLKNNLKTLDDPAFHLNRTLKQYINYKLNKNSGEKNIRETKHPIKLSKYKENNKSSSRCQSVSNIIKTKKVFPNKKIKKSIIINFLSKSKSKSKSNSRKKVIKSISNTKINHHRIHINQKNKNLIDNKIKKNIIFLKKNSNNSTHKYLRYSGSTVLSINDTNLLYEKNNLIIPCSNNNNPVMSNHSTLDINKLKTPLGQTTSKKNKFTSQYFSQNERERYSCSDFTHIKGKDKNCQNICLVKKSNNINTRNNYIDQDGNNVLFSDWSLNRKTTNSSNTFQNNNIIIEKQNNINYTVDLNGYNDFYKNNINNNNRYSYTISNEKNSPEKSNNTLNDFPNINQGNDNSNSNNKYEEKRKTDYKKDKNLEYIKRIEFLENENKVLKGEINESKNKLILLESKINKILFEKNSIEKEECPLPTPYVKKYSLQNLQNNPSNSNNININENENQKKPIIKEKENQQENMAKNKSFLNKIHKQILQSNINNHQKQKLTKLKKNKSSNFLKNVTKINVNKKHHNNFINNRNEKSKKVQKVNNMHRFVEGHMKMFKYTSSNFFLQENIKK